jgi:hypothetical protein
MRRTRIAMALRRFLSMKRVSL